MEEITGSQMSLRSAASVESVAHDAHSVYDAAEDSDSTHFSEDAGDNDDIEDGEAMEEGEFNWDTNFTDDAVEFEAEPGNVNSESPLSEESSPLDIFQQLITPEMADEICKESNRYAEQKKIRNYTTLTQSEFWRFVAVNLSMGVVKKSRIEDYWAVKTLFPTPFFNSVMARDRYRQLLRSLHFVDNTAVPANCKDKFIKLGNFLETLFRNVRRVVKLGEYLCLDESLVPFKGRLSIKQYNAKKRSRFGVKLFELADCATKVIVDILPYQGANTKLKFRHLKKDLGFGGVAVLTMLEPYFEKGHRVIVDNYFNSPKLARVLKQRKTYVLGTVQKRRKGMPKNSRMSRKMKKGEVEVFSDGDILVERWSDRRDVHMLNTFMPHSMQNVESSNPNNTRDKPGSVVLYNAKMGAVDDSDKVTAPLASTRKTYKWYRKVAFHLVDLAVYNSLQLYKTLTGKTVTYREFLEDLISAILLKYPNPKEVTRGRPAHQRDDQRLSGRHFPHKVLKRCGKSSKADCFYCKAVLGKRTSTVYGCRQCNKRLCIGSSVSCFELYHTQTTLRKVSTSQRQQQPSQQLTPTTPAHSLHMPLETRDEESEPLSESLLA